MTTLSKKIALNCFQKWHDHPQLDVSGTIAQFEERAFLAGYEAARPAPSDGVIPPDFRSWLWDYKYDAPAGVFVHMAPDLESAFNAGVHRAERLADQAIEQATDRANDLVGDLASADRLLAECAALFREYERHHLAKMKPGLIGGENAEPWLKADRNAAIARRIEEVIADRADLARFGTAALDSEPALGEVPENDRSALSGFTSPRSPQLAEAIQYLGNYGLGGKHRLLRQHIDVVLAAIGDSTIASARQIQPSPPADIIPDSTNHGRTPPTSDSGIRDNPTVRAVVADIAAGKDSWIAQALAAAGFRR